MENLVYPLLSLIPALLNLGILIYLIFFVPRLRTTDIFSFFVLLLVLWQAEDTIVRLCDNSSTALFWVKVLCIGWAGFAPVAFHFACRYTSLKIFYTRLSLVCLYLPFVICYLLYIATADDTIFTHRPGWSWIVTPREGTMDEIQRYLISLCVISAVFILFRYAVSIKNHKQKKLQALFIAFGILIPTVQGVITQVVFPVILDEADVPLTSSFLTLFSVATIYSMRRYKLFNISESVDVKTVLANLKNIVLVVSPQQQIIYMNPYGQELLTDKKKSADSFSIKTIFPSHSYYNDFITNAFKPSIEGNPIIDYSTVFQTGPGKKIDVLVSSELITNNNQVQGLLLVANDVTELSRTLRDLEASNKELEQFAYVASHDLQEPLRKMSNYLQLLEMKYKSDMDETGRKYISVAVSSGKQMRNLIQDLLEYSYITANKETNGTADMNEVVEDVIKSLALEIEESAAEIKYSPLPVLVGPGATQMRQLMQNLLSNALKYRSNKKIQIKIEAEDCGDYWKFFVEDNGIGIAEEYREKVFVVFQRLHTKSEYTGTGIGLAICKKIVEQYGGKIWVETNTNNGCTFFFTISKEQQLQEMEMDKN